MLSGQKTKVLIVQLGSPKSPSVSDVREFLREFLADPRVVDINPLLWKIILNCFVLPFRPKRSAQAYSRIWKNGEFPLIRITQDFAARLREHLPENIEINECFLLASPRGDEILKAWDQEALNTRAKKVLVLPQFPQYSESTVASGIDALFKALEQRADIPALEIVSDYHRSKAFIDNSARQINNCLAGQNNADLLVISFHGIPTRRVLYKNDPYYRHCYETYRLIKDQVTQMDSHNIVMTFQSRFGSEEWLQPYTDEYVINQIKNNKRKIAVYCPSFVVDCLETVDEIGHELALEAKHAGGEIVHIPCLNCDEQWVKDYAQYIKVMATGAQKDKEELFYQVDEEQMAKEAPEQKTKSQPLSPTAVTSIKVIFLTLFLDLIGFSIIFPMFPALAEHYLQVDSQNVFLKAIFGTVTQLTNMTDATASFTPIVLFGGVLGALYSFLQFLCAPFWGNLSDRIGRKPVLIISLFGLAFSYLLWVVSGSFTTLIFARFIGGIMAGNISTATAVVADVTNEKNRSRGMAFIGIAFALGFIIGPAMGGLLSLIDLSAIYPQLKEFGVNPFSTPALLAFILTCWNIYFIIKKFKETLPPEKRGDSTAHRSANPIILFKPLPFKGVNLTNFGHFFFLMAFSGMEFTLTFLAVERLNYTPMDNAYMFIFIGLVLALIQGGYVRRKAAIIGEKRMALQGITCIIPGLVLVGIANTTIVLYAGLFFLAIGSAMAIPCLTSLVSLYTPAEQQGRSIGIFRSLGALARVIGPLLACLIYWQLGASYTYYLGAIFLILPVMMVSRLPKPKEG